MFHRWAAPVLVLALCATSPKNAAGQTESKDPPRGHGAGTLGKPYPNPSSPESSVDFQVDTESCTDGSKPHVVTLRILNILGMPVGYFVLQAPPAGGPAAADSTVPNGAKLSEVKLGCGSYQAFWDGNVSSGKEAPAGTYVVQLMIDKKLAGTQKLYRK